MPSPHIPRPDRDLERGRRAAEKARAAGASAMEVALTAIDVTFDPRFREPNDLKRRVAVMIRHGFGHIETRNRYGNVAASLPDSLPRALAEVRTRLHLYRLYVRDCRRKGLRAERRDNDRWREAELLLRWIRARGCADAWPQIREAVTTPLWFEVPSLLLMPEAAE